MAVVPSSIDKDEAAGRLIDAGLIPTRYVKRNRTFHGFTESQENMRGFSFDGITLTQTYVSRLPEKYKCPFKKGDTVCTPYDSIEIVVTDVFGGYFQGVVIKSGEWGSVGKMQRTNIGEDHYPYALDAGWNPTLFQLKKDYSDVEVLDVWHGLGGFSVAWSSPTIGFGQLTISNGVLETESMSPAFCKAVYNKMVDKYFPK